MEEILKRCQQIANEAYKKELEAMIEEGPKYNVIDHGVVVDKVYDDLGFAHIKFRDGRNKFVRALKKFMGKDFSNIFSPYCCPRQELRIKKAMAYAVCDYINSLGANAYVKTFID